jgi:hypothetical protein
MLVRGLYCTEKRTRFPVARSYEKRCVMFGPSYYEYDENAPDRSDLCRAFSPDLPPMTELGCGLPRFHKGDHLLKVGWKADPIREALPAPHNGCEACLIGSQLGGLMCKCGHDWTCHPSTSADDEACSHCECKQMNPVRPRGC